MDSEVKGQPQPTRHLAAQLQGRADFTPLLATFLSYHDHKLTPEGVTDDHELNQGGNDRQEVLGVQQASPRPVVCNEEVQLPLQEL
jgi:hypothetical protein